MRVIHGDKMRRRLSDDKSGCWDGKLAGVDGVDEIVQAVGPRLRGLRRQRGITLVELSAITGISVSTLSRIESGQRRPTIELLLPLARAHQVPLDDIVGAPQTGDPRIHLKPFTANGCTFVPLTRRPGGLRAYKQIIPPNWPQTPPVQQAHEGYEWLYVLSGRVRILLGDQEVMLKAGEVAEFDTHLPHFVGNPGPRTAEVLNLFGPQGERLHVRARPRRRAGD
jgi:transcriptional regulator with XRE-family HTH domain